MGADGEWNLGAERRGGVRKNIGGRVSEDNLSDIAVIVRDGGRGSDDGG